MRSRRWITLVLAVGLLAGCSGDDDDDGVESTGSESTASESTVTLDDGATTTIPSLDADDIDADASPYCAAWAEIRAQGGPAVTGDDEADDAARREYYTDLLPLVEELHAHAPADVAAAVEIALATTSEVSESGDPAPFEEPEVIEAQQALAAYAQENCARS